MKSSLPTPIPVRKALKKLGADMKDARIRRRIPTTLMAERMGASRNTLKSIEDGKPGASIGMYVTALYILGMLERVRDLADIANDPVGQALSSGSLPKRIYLPRTKKND